MDGDMPSLTGAGPASLFFFKKDERTHPHVYTTSVDNCVSHGHCNVELGEMDLGMRAKFILSGDDALE